MPGAGGGRPLKSGLYGPSTRTPAHSSDRDQSFQAIDGKGHAIDRQVMSRSLSLRIVDFDYKEDVGAEASKPVHAILVSPRASRRQGTMSASTVSGNVATTATRPRTNDRARRSVVASRRCGPSISSFAANAPARSIVGRTSSKPSQRPVSDYQALQTDSFR